MSDERARDRQERRIWNLFEIAARIEFVLNEGHCPRETQRRARLHIDEVYRLIKQALLTKNIPIRSMSKIGDEIEDQLRRATEAIWPEGRGRPPQGTR